MRVLPAMLTIALTGVTGCTTIQVPQRDYANVILGTWLYTGTVQYPFHGTYREEHIPSAVAVFHSDGRFGVGSLADPPSYEYIAGKRWRIEGDKLFVIPDKYSSPEDRRLASTLPERIDSFTADKFTTTDGITIRSTYTRIRKQPNAPNQTLQRTPTRRAPPHFP